MKALAVEQHSMLNALPSDARLWRFMSFTKFVSLLQSRSLYFCNLERLAELDPYEGLLAEPNYRHRVYECIDDMDREDRAAARIDERGLTDELRQLRFSGYIQQQEDNLQRAFAMRRSFFVNCWYMKEHESAAMWAIYGGGREGVAITSSAARLTESFLHTEARLFLSQVRYIDYIVDKIPAGNSFFPVIHKRIDFEHEQEARIIHWDTDVSHRTELIHLTPESADSHKAEYRMVDRSIEEMEAMPRRHGIYTPCDIDKIIEDVYTSPGSPSWFLELVQSVTHKYKLKRNVRRSSIDATPKR